MPLLRRFRKKPIEITAAQWDGTAEGATPIIDWILAAGGTANYICSDVDRCAVNHGDTPHWIAIQTPEGAMNAGLGWWVIRGMEGEFYPCKPSVFDATYESVEES